MCKTPTCFDDFSLKSGWFCWLKCAILQYICTSLHPLATWPFLQWWGCLKLAPVMKTFELAIQLLTSSFWDEVLLVFFKSAQSTGFLINSSVQCIKIGGRRKKNAQNVVPKTQPPVFAPQNIIFLLRDGSLGKTFDMRVQLEIFAICLTFTSFSFRTFLWQQPMSSLSPKQTRTRTHFSN